MYFVVFVMKFVMIMEFKDDKDIDKIWGFVRFVYSVMVFCQNLYLSWVKFPT